MIDEKGYQEREYKRKRSEEFCRSMYACSPSPPFLLSPAHELFLDRVCWAPSSSFCLFLPTMAPSPGVVQGAAPLYIHGSDMAEPFPVAASSCRVSAERSVRKLKRLTLIILTALDVPRQKQCSRSTLLSIYENCFLNLKLKRAPDLLLFFLKTCIPFPGNAHPLRIYP